MITARVRLGHNYASGQNITLQFSERNLHIFDVESGLRMDLDYEIVEALAYEVV